MNRIIQSHLASFQKASGLDDLDTDDAFEHFLNYCIGYRHTGSAPDTAAITTDDPDAGIDGIICLVDNEIVATAEECEEIFARSKRNVEARLVFTQATSTESFSKEKLTAFLAGVYDFMQTSPNLPHGAVLSEHHEIFGTIVTNAHKVVHGKPECEVYYAATGRYNQDIEIEGALKSGKIQIESTGLFAKTSVSILDADALLRLWLECTQTVSASVAVVGSIPLAKTPKIPEAYLAVVSARELVEKLLANENKELRAWVFNENVRAFLGADGQVNTEIQKTIRDSDAKARFALLNNGMTVVSPDIRVQGNTISLNGFQIVNGCQTSHVLFSNLDYLTPEVTIAVKFIEADDPDVVGEIVRATNKQTRVEDSQFLALEPLTKRIEEYFKSYTKEEQRVYFERRFRQYVGAGVPQIRTFDIKSACRAVSSMFLNRPDLAMRYPNQMLTELHDRLFDEKNKEVIFYVACLGLYKINLLISSGKLPSNFRRMKWHLLLATRLAISGSKVPQLGAGSIDGYCKPLIEAYSNPNPLFNPKFENAVDVIKTFAAYTRDKLTTKTIAQDLQAALGAG